MIVNKKTSDQKKLQINKCTRVIYIIRIYNLNIKLKKKKKKNLFKNTREC